MTFLETRGFYLLTVVPLLILIHLLSVRRRQFVVPSIWLWGTFTQDSGARRFSWKNKHCLRLFIQILSVVCVTLALARPVITGISSRNGELLVIIDSSASMLAHDGGVSRIDRAKLTAMSIVRTTETNSIVIVSAASPPEMIVRADPKSESILIQSAIESIHASQGAADLVSAIISYCSDETSAILVITDTDIDSESIPESVRGKVVVRRVGGYLPNSAITGLSMVYDPFSREYIVTTRVANFRRNGSILNLSILIDGEALETRTMELGERESISQVFRLSESAAGREIELRIAGDDALAIDNSVILSLPRRDGIRCLLVSESPATRRFLGSALMSIPFVALDIISPDQYLQGTTYDLIIFDNWVPPTAEKGMFFFINPGASLPSIPVFGMVSSPPIVDWNRTHPIMRQVDFSGIKIAEMHKHDIPDWAVPLLMSDGYPLIWYGESIGYRAVVSSFDMFDPAVTDFPWSVQCPIFVQNMVSWFLARKPAETMLARVGEYIDLTWALGEDITTWELVSPTGQRTSSGQARSGFWAREEGVYRVESDGHDLVRVYVNMIDEAESDLSANLGSDGFDGKPVRTVRAVRELWRWFVLAAIMLLIAEWWTYHQRR